MINYDNWKEIQVPVTNLLLDPSNPRIPGSGENLTQRDLLRDLVENDKVYELARSIADKGYYPIESLIIVEENGKKYVLEGNRRLAALMLLLSPEAAPENWEKRFRNLAARVELKALMKVKALIAPTREAAAPLIMSKHTKKDFEGWSPLMQAKFYRNLVSEGLTIDDIADQYSTKPSEITDAFQRYEMYEIACILDLPDEVMKRVHNPREFHITTLDRLYKTPLVNEFLGITFDKEKQLKGKIKEAEFIKGYSKMITDIAMGKIGSRNLNKIQDIKKYLDSFGPQKPDLTTKGRFTAKSLLKATSIGRPTLKKPKGDKKSPRAKPRQRALIPARTKCELSNQRINDVFEELKKLDVAKFPNSVSLMFRSLIEMSISYYLKQTKDLKAIIDKEKNKRKGDLPRDWQPTLIQMLKFIVEQEDKIIDDPNLRKVLRKLVSAKDQFISIDSLNMLVHNEHFYPTEDMLRKFWASFEGLFRIILIEPD